MAQSNASAGMIKLALPVKYEDTGKVGSCDAGKVFYRDIRAGAIERNIVGIKTYQADENEKAHSQ